MRLQSRWQCEAFSLCPFLATSAFNLHYLPAEFSVIQQKFPLVLITPQADPVMSEQLWRMFEICSDTRELLLAVFSPDSFWKREETLCSCLYCSGMVFPSCQAEREKGRRVLFKYHRHLLLLLGFSRFMSKHFFICDMPYGSFPEN